LVELRFESKGNHGFEICAERKPIVRLLIEWSHLLKVGDAEEIIGDREIRAAEEGTDGVAALIDRTS
jgi:hypothetical protein